MPIICAHIQKTKRVTYITWCEYPEGTIKNKAETVVAMPIIMLWREISNHMASSANTPIQHLHISCSVSVSAPMLNKAATKNPTQDTAKSFPLILLRSKGIFLFSFTISPHGDIITQTMHKVNCHTKTPHKKTPLKSCGFLGTTKKNTPKMLAHFWGPRKKNTPKILRIFGDPVKKRPINTK